MACYKLRNCLIKYRCDIFLLSIFVIFAAIAGTLLGIAYSNGNFQMKMAGACIMGADILFGLLLICYFSICNRCKYESI